MACCRWVVSSVNCFCLHTTVILTVCYINRQPGRGYHYSETNACGESASKNKAHLPSNMSNSPPCSGAGTHGYKWLVHYTDRYLFVKRRKSPKGSKCPHLVTKICKFPQGDPRLGPKKCLAPQSGTWPDFLAKKKINQFQWSITFF